MSKVNFAYVCTCGLIGYQNMWTFNFHLAKEESTLSNGKSVPSMQFQQQYLHRYMKSIISSYMQQKLFKAPKQGVTPYGIEVDT